MRIRRIIHPVLLLLFLMVTAITVSSCFKNIPTKQLVYQNDFEDSSMRNFSFYDMLGPAHYFKVIPYNGSAVLGRFNNRLVRLTLDNLPSHNIVHIEFDLYIHDQWDGDYLRPGTTIPDVWNMKLDNYVIYQTTFSNGPYNQSFPDNYKGRISINPARSNAWGVSPGVCSLAGKTDGTSHYKIDIITAHATPGMELDLSDATQPFNDLCLKSWSIDNVRISADTYTK